MGCPLPSLEREGKEMSRWDRFREWWAAFWGLPYPADLECLCYRDDCYWCGDVRPGGDC